MAANLSSFINSWMNQLEYFRYRRGQAEVFADWVRLLRMSLQHPLPQDQADKIRAKYDPQELEVLSSLSQIYFSNLQHQVERKEWADLLGVAYEAIASQKKSQWLGQFFTPPDVCNLLAALKPVTAEQRAQGVTVADNAGCGAGRNLLAFHTTHFGPHYYYAVDIDPICVDMCAINMAVHGLRGDVVLGNALGNTVSTRFSINRHLSLYQGVPHIFQVAPGDNSNYIMWEAQRSKSETA